MTSRELSDDGWMLFEKSHGFAWRHMVVFDRFGNHESMPNFRQNDDRAKSDIFFIFDLDQQLSAIFVLSEEMINKNVGVKEYLVVGGDSNRQLTLQRTEGGRFSQEFTNPFGDVNNGFGRLGRAFKDSPANSWASDNDHWGWDRGPWIKSRYDL